MSDVKFVTVDGRKTAYSVFGNGRIDTVVMSALGSSMGEWWHVAQRLSGQRTVLLYERAGYGSSDCSEFPRTPQNIAEELYELLKKLECQEKLTIVAHSQGALYAQQFVHRYGENVEKLILLDPLSANDNYFKQALSRREYQKGGVDKSSALYIQYALSRLHMGGVIKKMMRQAPPFYYFNGFSEETSEYILNSYTKPMLYKTAIEENRLAHDDSVVASLKSGEGFPQLPIYLITHNSEIAVREIVEFGGLTAAEAGKVETIWQNLMKEYLSFSDRFHYIQAEHSSHYIHLTDTELLCQVVFNLL